MYGGHCSQVYTKAAVMLYVLWTSYENAKAELTHKPAFNLFAKNIATTKDADGAMTSCDAHDARAFWQRTWSALPKERQNKIQAYRHEHDKNLRAASYFTLRWALLQEFGIKKDFAWEYGSYGKPHLKGTDISFSLSYTPNALVCAVAKEEVGVDIEPWQSFDAKEHIYTHRIFSPEEMYRIARAEITAEAACTLWTAKESVFKYSGEGLRGSLPNVLQRKDVRVHTLSFAEYETCVALCLNASSSIAKPAITEVHFESLQIFWREAEKAFLR